MPRTRTVTAFGALGAAGVLALVVAAPASAAGVVANWQLNEKSGTVVHDASGNGHRGTAGGVTDGVSSPTGSAYAFNGTSSIVTVPDADALDPHPESGPFTVSVSLRLDRLPKGPDDFDIIRKGILKTPGGYWKMQVSTSGHANCRFRGTAGDLKAVDPAVLDDHQWHDVTCTATSTGVTVTVDGRSTTKAGNFGTIATDAPLTMGTKTAHTDFFAGRLDYARIEQG